MKLKILVFIFTLISLGFVVKNNILARDGGPAAQDPDINIRLRGWQETSFSGGLLDHPENTDTRQPELSSAFTPSFGRFFQINSRSGSGFDSSNLNTPGMATISPIDGSSVLAPISGYPIGGGFYYTVLYASDSDIVIHAGTDDSVAVGYTIHFINFIVSPQLKKMYDENEAKGRKQLLAIPCKEVLGQAPSGEVMTSIRDSGSFMDIRFKDWWGASPAADCNGNAGFVDIGSNPSTATKPYDVTPEVPCDATSVPPLSDPEYHSLRPYPANPCLKKVQDTALLCSNDLVVVKTASSQGGEGPGISRSLDNGGSYVCTTSSNGSYSCTYKNIPMTSKVSVDLSNAQLPIMGNTEDVPNATWTSLNTNANNLNPAQRVNNYVSWYLNGVFNRSEEDFSNYDAKSLVNYSGPLNKLLPYTALILSKFTGTDLGRVASINNAANTPAKIAANANDTTTRHNQIVGCPIGKNIILPTYLCTYQMIIDTMVSNGLNTGDILGQIDVVKLLSRIVAFNDKRLQRPIESDYSSFEDYWKAYLSWKGNVCPSIPFTRFYFCVDADLNLMGVIFDFIPLSTTEDRVGTIGTNQINTLPNLGGSCRTAQAPCSTTCNDANHTKFQDACPGNGSFDSCTQWAQQACHDSANNSTPEIINGNPVSGGVAINSNADVTFTPDNVTNNIHNLYFAHVQETAELSKMLQSTFKSTFATSTRDTNTSPEQQPGCIIADTRTNPGDNLYGNINRKTEGNYQDQAISGTVNFKGSYTCRFGPVMSNGIVIGGTSVECDKATASLSIYTQSPEVENNWINLVGGSQSVFKRFFPKVGADSLIKEIKEVPAVTNVTYNANGDQVAAGSTARGVGGSATAQVYIPYVGGIKDYFLDDIQTALRPQGMGTGQLASSLKSPQNTSNLNINCNKNAPDPGKVAGLKDKQTLINEFNHEFPGNHIGDCYNDLVGQAKAGGYNAGFVMATWIEESGASDYTQFSDVSDFGCTSKSHNDFSAQLSCFLGLKSAYVKEYPQCQIPGNNQMQNFLLVFSEGPNGGACTPTSPNYNKFVKNAVFPTRILNYYQRVSGNSTLPDTP